MITATMDLAAWDVAPLAAEAEDVRGGDPIDGIIVFLVGYFVTNAGSFVQGFEDGWDIATHN